MKKQDLKCKYCGKKMHKIDFDMYNGYCGKCRDILDWKKTLNDIKEYKK